MDAFTAQSFASALALVGIIILVSALLSGLIERSGLPQVAVFLALGAVLGPAGLGILNLSLQSPIVRIVATLSLVLVLFTDAVTIDLREMRRFSKLIFLVLGPGTLLATALFSLAGWGLLGLAPAAAIILGAALASTDPVLLRGLLRRRDTPTAARHALRLEGGLNDVVVLPVVLIAMAFLGHEAINGAEGWAHLGLELFLLGPSAGIIVGLFSVATLDLVRRRIGVRRDYEALYSLGVAFSAYAAAEAMHGSGFLAAFAAGLTISIFDVELCDCFLEYGETTAEMALLFAFVVLGSSLIWSGFMMISAITLLFALLVILLRPALLLALLSRVNLDRNSRYLIAWFGPRGLSSLLLVLLPVFENLPGSELLFQICCLVVIISIFMHGGSLMLIANLSRKQPAEHRQVASPAEGSEPAVDGAAELASVPEAPVAAQEQVVTFKPGAVAELAEATGNGVPADPIPVSDPIRITLEELRMLRQHGDPVIILDARTERSFGNSLQLARGALRLVPDHVADRAREMGLSHDAWLVAFCA